MPKHSIAEGFGIMIFGLLLAGAAIFAGAFLSGWVFVSLWDWFVRPVFTSAPAVTIWQAYGVMFFLRFMTFKMSELDDKDSEGKDYSDHFADCIGGIFKFAAYCALTVFIGWIAWSLIY